MIGEYVTTADMVKDKESAVKKRKRGQAKGGVMSTDKGGEGRATKEGQNEHDYEIQQMQQEGLGVG